MKITDEYILSLDIFDTKGRLKLIAFNKILDNNPEIKEYLKNRFTDKFVDYKTSLWRIRKGIEIWPTCPTCGKMLDNLKHIHCSTRCSSLDPEVKKKNETTNLKLYGVKNSFNISSVREKAKEGWSKTIIEKYGSIENWRKVCVPIIKESKEQKIQNDPDYWKKVKQKEKETRERKLLNDPLYNKKAKDKEIETKRRNGTLNSSSQEDEVYKTLCKIFNKKDVLREYSDNNRYPFHCDFYIKSKDLFIECNFHWSHGEHWFDKNSAEDLQILQEWKNKNSQFYNNATETWTKRDVIKRETAIKNKINYLVFWSINEFKNFNLEKLFKEKNIL